jgi:hypothetical protein
MQKLRTRAVPILGMCVLVLLGAVYAEHRRATNAELANRNYYLLFSTPKGWVPIPHSPEALFLYREPKTNLLLRGAMSDVVSDSNPTPELDTDGTAQWILDITSENMKDWTGQLLDVVDAQGTKFRLVRRSKSDKCVVSAVAVEGNTTALVTLSADKGQLASIDGEMPAFRQYLATLGFQRHIWAK